MALLCHQQIFAAAAVIALGLCAVAFVTTSSDGAQEDSISNIYSGYVSSRTFREQPAIAFKLFLCLAYKRQSGC